MRIRQAAPIAVFALVIGTAACGGIGPRQRPDAATGTSVATRTPDGPAATSAAPTVGFPRPAALVDLPVIELIAPGPTGAGSTPLFEWRTIDGAATYRLLVRGADGRSWAWQGTGTAVRYGGVTEAQPGPVITPGTLWSVAALGVDDAIIALSDWRAVSPTDDPGPAPTWLVGVSHTGPSPTPRPTTDTRPAVDTAAGGPCALLTTSEIAAAIKGTWGPPNQSETVDAFGSCTWTSANGTLLTLYVAAADQYDPDGWGADETMRGLGDRAYRVTKGWDRRIGFVSRDYSIMLTIDYPKVDPGGFAELASRIEGRLP